jgi:hyperosmotically inducible protein
MPSRLPAAADRVEVVAAGGEIDRVPMSVGTPDAAASAPVVASDSTITTAVKSAIASEGLGKDSSIGVTTTDGVVALSGSVPSQSAIDQVKDVAGKVSGVKLVDTSGLVLASL